MNWVMGLGVGWRAGSAMGLGVRQRAERDRGESDWVELRMRHG